MLQLLLFPPIAISWLITGTAMLIFFFGIGIGRGSPAVILGHVALALPYVIVVVSARWPASTARWSSPPFALGAGPMKVTMAETVPGSAGIIAGGLFAFAVSFDQFVVSYFLSEPATAHCPC